MSAFKYLICMDWSCYIEIKRDKHGTPLTWVTPIDSIPYILE